MAVKITGFEAENVKRIKAVRLTPTENGLTIIGGDNNQGKTSVLDAIAWALGGDRYRPQAATREGAYAPPALRVTLSNGLVVERKGKNSVLVVTDTTGRRGGQQILDAFVEKLAIDLPRFLNATDRDKADTLLRIIGVGDELGKLDREIKSLYDRRTFIGQEASRKRHYADEMIEYPDAPDEPISASELIRRQQEILAQNGLNQRMRENAARLREKRDALAARLDELTAQYEQARQECALTEKSASELIDESTAELEESIRGIEEINRKVRANMDKERAAHDAEELAAQYQALSEQIERKRGDRLALLDTAKLPLPGLSVEDGALTYQGKRWEDMSGSDQLRVGTAIVRRLNPECGFVLLDKLEQMDRRTLEEFAEWLEAERLQAIATRVSTGDECSVIIEDGRILGDEAPETKPPKKWQEGEF